MTRRQCLAPSIVQVQRCVLALFLLFAATAPAELHAQIAGQSVNMVSGTQWPGGDPFLQRQNEPSIAVSSRNPRHLLAGANDYRTVDVPFSTPDAPETGDAWLGVFKSFDGGITWKSTLLPGYPQQNPRTGPLATFSTAADPVVRAGTNGLFYYAGIAFNRDTKDGVVFVARFVDLNNKENGDPTRDQDPIRYIDTKVVDRGTGTPFIDKPWIAVDKPRLLDGVCNLTVPQPLPGNPNATVQQTVPAGAVYAAWTEATGSGSSLTTNVYFSSSSDCGASWGTPVRINDVNRVNQGASIAIDPATGVVYVVWRRFASGSQTDAILVSRSLRGRIFSKPTVVVSLPAYAAAHPTAPSFFDQGTTADSFRTNAYPTIAIDRRPNTGADDDDEPDDPPHRGRVYVAWSQRGVAPTGDARVVLSASTDGGQSWSTPAPVDNAALADDSGNHFSRGHQFMPQMTSTANQVTVIYYDARLDHTFGLFSPRSNPLAPDPVTGKLYLEARDLRGELLDANGATKVFTPFFLETGMTEWRHTLDLRAAQANAAAAPVFTSSQLSQYIFGTRGGPSELQLTQLQINPPNLKLFQEGSVPFLGDYIDIAGQTFLPPVAPGRRWRFNSKPDPSAVYVASWTSNQDVRPPLDGNWANFTPSSSTGGNSIFNPGIQRPPCVPGQEGMRDQNIYAARILQGLVVSSVQNAKPLSTILQRALAVNVENLTPLSRTFRLTIAGQPVGGRASFVPARNPPPKPLPAPTTTLDVTIPPNSAVARSVYALSTDPNARIEVDVAEVAGPPGGLLKANGLTSFVIFNTDPSAPTLVNPDNSTAPSVTTVEVYNPNVTNPNVTNPDLANPNVTNPNVTNPNVTNPNVTNPNVTNPNVTNPNVTNAPVSDATYTVTNNGNTTSAYSIRLAGSAPGNTPIQIIISKPYTTPASLNCVLFEQQHNIPVASIVNPRFIDPNSPPDPGITDPSEGNATFVLAPGESILVTIRGPVDIPTLTNIVQNLAPVIVAHASNTNDPTNRPASSPPVITTFSLPDGVLGQAYAASLKAVGGTPPYVAWTATGLPGGLSINSATGGISGTPTTPILAVVIVAVTDSAGKTGQRILNLRVAAPLTIATPSLPNGSPGVPYSQPLSTAGGTPPAAFSVVSGAVPSGLVLSSSGVLAGTPTAAGTFVFTVAATDLATPPQTATRSFTVTIGTIQLVATSAPTSAVGGQPFAVSFHVQDGGGAPLPGVSVTVGLGASPCPAALLSGTLLAVSNGTGDALFPALSIDRGGAGFTIVGTASLPSAPSATTALFPVEGFCDTGGLSSPRKWHTATRLDNGKVLVAGGFDGTSALATAELYDPTTRTYTLTGSMGTARVLHSATLLTDGRVLVVGGGSGFEAGTLKTAELYDPASGIFSPAGSLAGNTRQAHGAVRLNDGTVLIAGGFTNDGGISGLATAELYDPASGSFTPTASNMTHDRIGDFTTDLLPDGRVLLAGGSRNLVGGSVADAELFSAPDSFFAPTSNSMSARRGKHAAELRADGKVLLTGGENDTGFLATTDLFDPAGDSFAVSPASMTIPREAHTASRLATGRTLLAGGQTLSGLTVSVLASAELYDAALGSTPTGSLRVARQIHTATPLLDGTILMVGGAGTSGSSLSSSELFFPSAVLNITTTAIPTGFQGHPYQAILLTASGTPPFVWTAMALPAGLVLSSAGVLAGTPAAAGPTSVWVKVTDASGNSALARFPIFVAASTASNGPVTISGVSINGGGSEAVVLEGSTVTVALSYTIVDTLCPACIDQIPIGFAGSVPTACVYDGIPGPAGVSGSGSVSLTAPAVPGRYYVGFDRSQAFTCSGALGFWWNGAPGPSRYIGAIDVIDPHATDGPVTISNGSINGDGISATVSAGATYTMGLDYFIVDGPCPGCIDQIQMGLTVGPAETCAYDGIPGPAGVSGSSTVSLTAPTASGRYAIGFDRSQQFFCPTGAWWNSRPDAPRTVGVIVVP